MKKIVLVLVFSIIFLSGCNYIPDDDLDTSVEFVAPGCEGGGIVPTGCLGKSIIKDDFKIAPAVECIELHVNNCNGGILRIWNNCDYDLRLGSEVFYAGSNDNLELVRDAMGKVHVTKPAGNFDSYCPEEEDFLSVEGMLGEQKLTVSYTKENVCGTAKTPEIYGVLLKPDKAVYNQGDTVTVKVETDGFPLLSVGYPPFQVYRLINNDWELVSITCECTTPCDAEPEQLCAVITCAPLPESCFDFDTGFDEFSWDMTECKFREADCPEAEQEIHCSYEDLAEPGTYKIIFQYVIGFCSSEDYFLAEENDVQEIEVQFEIK